MCTLNFMVTRVPVSLGTILGFSVKVGGKASVAALAGSAAAFSGGGAAAASSPAATLGRIELIDESLRKAILKL